MHLPLVDFGEGGARAGELRDDVRAARELGFNTLSANDHLLWRRPWLDGLTALSAVPRGQMIATLSAWGPFWPWLTSKDTRWPSSKAL